MKLGISRLTLFVICAVILACDKSESYRLVSEKYNFSVEFPEKPLEQSKVNDNVRELVDRPSQTLSTIGPGTFRYAFEPFDPPYPFGTALLIRFYDHKAFVCVTASK